MKTSSKCDFPVDQTTRQETRHHGDSSLPIVYIASTPVNTDWVMPPGTGTKRQSFIL